MAQYQAPVPVHADYLRWGIRDIDANRSGEQRTVCPKCGPQRRPEHRNEKDLSVNTREGKWQCKHCGKGGNVSRGWYDDPAPERDSLQSVIAYNAPRPVVHVDRKSAAGVMFDEFARARRLPTPVLTANSVVPALGYCPMCERVNGKAPQVAAIAFQYFKNGDHVHTKYRHPDPKDDTGKRKHFFCDPGTDHCLYGYDHLMAMPDDGVLVICEGEADVLAGRTADARNQFTFVSVPDGAPNPGDRAGGKLKCLDDPAVLGAWQRASKVVIATDADGPGRELAKVLVQRAPRPEVCYDVIWPEGIKDLNDALMHTDSAYLLALLTSAEPFPVEGVLTFTDMADDIDRYYEEGLPTGRSTGWVTLDPHLNLLPGDLWVLHGRTGVGKSAWLNALLVNQTLDSPDFNFSICSPEWTPSALHGISLMETFAGKPFDRFRYPETAMTRDDLTRAAQWLDRHATFINPRQRDMKTILDKALIAKFRRGTDMMIIDPFTELDHSGAGRDRLDYIDQVVSEYQDWLRDRGVLGVLVCHQSKPTTRTDDNGNIRYLPAGVYGATGAAAFANKADVVIEYDRPDDESNESIITVHKLRKKFLGVAGSVSLWYDIRTGRFHETRFMPSDVRSVG